MYIKFILLIFSLFLFTNQHPGHAGDKDVENKEETGKSRDGGKNEETDNRRKQGNETEKEKSKVKYSTADENIQILDYRSLSKTVYSSNKLTLVQFYGKIIVN